MATPLRPFDLTDLTHTLHQSSKRLAGTGSFGTVYRCSCAQNGEVAVKAISFPRSFDRTERDVFLRKMRRELGIWKRLDHPSIVPFLGTAHGEDFGSDYICMVSMWMSHGTLIEYVQQHENMLSFPSRIRLITGSVAGLEYLHSKFVVHGDLHPGNILIDSDRNPRLTDFGFSHNLIQQNDSSYDSTYLNPVASLWVAPELLYPELYPDHEPDFNNDLMVQPTLSSDIYSLGNIILFILSGKLPWNKTEFERKSNELQNPPRPLWPVIPDAVWDFIEQCWSPQIPTNRPPAREVLSFSQDRLGQLLQPNPASDINVVLFGALGCGKSSIINLLAGEPIAPVSADMEPCTTQPQCYQISIGERRFRLWDTMGFPCEEDGSTLSAFEQAHAVLRDLPDGVHIILLCAHKNGISSLGRLYWLINDFFFGGRAPIVVVATHFDTPDKRWWERNQRVIARRARIPIQSIPRLCTTTVETGSDLSRQTLKTFLETVVIPIPLCLNLSSHETASLDIATHFGLSNHDSMALVEKLSRARDGRQDDGGESCAYEFDNDSESPYESDSDSEDSDSDVSRADRVSRKSRRRTGRPSCSPSPTRVTTTKERPSTGSATPMRRVHFSSDRKSPSKPTVLGTTSHSRKSSSKSAVPGDSSRNRKSSSKHAVPGDSSRSHKSSSKSAVPGDASRGGQGKKKKIEKKQPSTRNERSSLPPSLEAPSNVGSALLSLQSILRLGGMGQIDPNDLIQDM